MAKYECDCEIIHEDKVNEVKSKMLSDDEYLNLSDLFKMFADSTRVRIMHALEKSELCVCDLANLLNMTKSAISHQLQSLRLMNLVKYRKEGQVVYYSLKDDHVKKLIDIGFEHISEGK
ncbi:MAG: winged helix-turn-helix transcriptional regulator [Clostridiales bacterium]|nr:winged helix-turn-helix transcriptional regulator [Clostridiales bacterium]